MHRAASCIPCEDKTYKMDMLLRAGMVDIHLMRKRLHILLEHSQDGHASEDGYGSIFSTLVHIGVNRGPQAP